VVDVIDARVPLKRAGSNHLACCPFHNEKTPSFTVSQSKQFYHCFGCGAHGTAIGFLMEYDRMSFPEAVEELARLAGMEVPKEAEAAFTSKSDEFAPLYDLLGQVANYYRQQLKKSTIAVDYLKKRGMSGKTAQAFGVGFTPPGWDNVLRHFGKTDADKQKLLRTGLLIEKDGGGYYDRFRNRIMFPIRNRRGNVIGFGGRCIDPNDTPKYLNSPETLLFHKGRELYGLHEVQQQRPRANTILVVEGYMDVVMLAEHGVNNSVATLGTATSREHIQTLFKTAPEIIFCFDGDRAGRDAAWRALETSLPEMDDRHQIKFLFLPQNEDPDSYTLKHGRDKFQSLLETSTVSLATYLFENLTSRFGKSPEGLAQLADEAKDLISKTQDNVFRQLLLKELSAITGLTVKQQPIHSPQNQHQRLQKIKLVKGDVRTLIIALLTEPSFAQIVRSTSELKLLNNPGMDLLLELIETIHSNPNMNTAMIVERYRESEHRDAISILATEEFSIPNLKSDLESLRRVFTDGIQRLLSKARDERFQQLIRKSADKTISPEEKQELQSFYEKKNS
ncbi:MAG TPA: DNA primase, partial [Gammaproteobacteria bacterium]